MNKIRHKLRSRTGASMILALVFLLFCSFVGSTVLVSATANSYRVAHLADQQDYLSQRSTALLISDELQLEDNERLQLNVVDSVKSTQEVNIINGGGVVPTATAPKVERIITFQLATNVEDLTPMQQLMLETTVWRYMQTNPTDTNTVSGGTTVKLQSFPAATSTDQFWYQWAGGEAPIEGSIQIEGTATVKSTSGVTILDSFDAYFTSGKDSDIYDFMVDFGEFSQLKITMNAFSGTTNEIELSTMSEDSENLFSTGYIQVTTKTTQTVISWDDPFIEKGGA